MAEKKSGAKKPAAKKPAAKSGSKSSNPTLTFVSGRRTPIVTPAGQKRRPLKKGEGHVTKTRKATDEEKRKMRGGRWLRVNERGETPGDSGYMSKKSKVRPKFN